MANGLSRPGVLPEIDPDEPRNPLAAALGEPVPAAPAPTIATPALATTPEAVAAGAGFRLPDIAPPAAAPAPAPAPGVIGPATAAREKFRAPKGFVPPTARNLAIARAGPIRSMFSVFNESLAEFAATLPAAISAGTQTVDRAIEEKLGRPPIPEERRLIQKNTPLVGFLAGDRDPNAQLAEAIADIGKGGPRNQELLDAKIIADITLGNLASGAGSLTGFGVSAIVGGPLVRMFAGVSPNAARTIAGATVGAASGIARGTADALENKPDISAKDLAFTQLLTGVLGSSEIIPLEIALRPFTRPFKRRLARVIASGSATGIAEALQEGGANIGEDAIAKAIFDADREIGKTASEGAQVGGVLGFVLGALTGLVGRKAQKRSGLGDGADADAVPPGPAPPAGGPAEAATQAADADAAAGAAGGPETPGGAPGGAGEAVGVTTDRLAELEAEQGTVSRIIDTLEARKAAGETLEPEQEENLREQRATLRKTTEDLLKAARDAAEDIGTEAERAELPKAVRKETEKIAAINNEIAGILKALDFGGTVAPTSKTGKRLTALRKQRDELVKRAEKRRAKQEKERGEAEQKGAGKAAKAKGVSGEKPVQPAKKPRGRARKKPGEPTPEELRAEVGPTGAQRPTARPAGQKAQGPIKRPGEAAFFVPSRPPPPGTEAAPTGATQQAGGPLSSEQVDSGLRRLATFNEDSEQKITDAIAAGVNDTELAKIAIKAGPGEAGGFGGNQFSGVSRDGKFIIQSSSDRVALGGRVLGKEIRRIFSPAKPAPAARPKARPKAKPEAPVAPAPEPAAAEAAEQAELAKKAQARADKNAKISATKQKQFQQQSRPNPTVDDVLTAVAKFGGINRAEAEAEGIDPAEFGRKVGIRRPFTKTGISLEEMAQNLADLGYPVTTTVAGEAKGSGQALFQAIENALAGRPTFSTAAGDATLEAQAQAALDQRQREFEESLSENPADATEDPLPGETLAENEFPADFDAAHRRTLELSDELEQLEEGAGEAILERAAIQDLSGEATIQALEEAINERTTQERAGAAVAKQKKRARPQKKAAAKTRLRAGPPETEPGAAEGQADLAPEATTAEQLRAKKKAVEERLRPKKEPEVSAGPLFDDADRKDFEKKQGDLFKPVSVADAERKGKTPKSKKARREDEQARANGTRKLRVDPEGRLVQPHQWSRGTGLDTVAYTLQVNPSITANSVVMDTELTRDGKFNNSEKSNVAQGTSNIHFRQARKALVQALSDLVDGGMPRAWVDGVRKYVAESQADAGTAWAGWDPVERMIAIREDLLDDVANIPVEGRPAEETRAILQRNQRVLAHILAHEIAHSIDTNHGNPFTIKAQSWSSPLFSIDNAQMSLFEVHAGKKVSVFTIDVPDGSMGPALLELYRIYENNTANLGKNLRYPLARLPALIDGVRSGALSESDARDLRRFIQHEAFAQGAGYYFTHRATIERHAPTFARLMKELVDGTPKRTESPRKRDARIRETFQGTPALGRREVDALEPTDQTAQPSGRVRQEARRVQGISGKFRAAPPEGDVPRSYTPAQIRVSKKGGFGEVEPLTLREKVGGLVERIKTLNWRTVRQGVLDRYNSFRDKKLLNDPVAHMLATMSNSANSLHEAIMKFGIPRLEKSGAVLVGTRLVERGTDDQGRIIREVERLPGKGKEGFEKGVEEILEPLGKEAPDWWKWVVAQRAQQLLDQGREKLFDRQDIIDLLTYADGELPGDSTRGSRLRLYQDVLDELMEVHFAIVDMNVEQGTISKKDAKIWKDHGLYVPFFRDLIDLTTQPGNKGPQTSAGLVFQTAFKRLKGADQPLANPMQNMLDNWHHLLGSGLKNAAGRRALATAETLGIATRLNEPGEGVSAFTQKRRDTVFVRENGQPVWYQINEPEPGGRFTKEDHALVLNSLMGLHTEGLNHFSMRAMRFMKRQFTAIIVINPNFKIANLFRDTFQAAAIGGISANPFRNLVRGWKATEETSATNIAGLSTGGFFEQTGYVHGSDPEAINRLTKKGVKRNTILDFTNPRVLISLFRKYQAIGVRGENVNRAAKFEADLAKGKTLLEASFGARDLLDFTRSGSWPLIAAMGQTIPFFQARLQGLDRFGRGALDPKQRGQFAAVTLTYILASLGAYLLIRDDEEYKQTEEWERDTYHFFRGPDGVLIRVPRPFELGAMGTIAERLAQQVVDKDAHAELFFDRLKFAIAQTFAFNPIPQAALPVVELWGNKNFFTNRPIESLSMKNLPPEERRRIYTSETSILLSRLYNTIAWEEIELSPVQIEHLAQGYWGWMGATVLGALDLLFTRPAIGEPPKPSPQIQDWPFVGRWVREAPQRHTGPAQVYFDILKDAQQTFNTIREARERGEAGRAQKIFDRNRALLAQRKGLVRTQRRLSNIQDQIARARQSRTLSAEQKRRRINTLRRQRQRLIDANLRRARAAGVQ